MKRLAIIVGAALLILVSVYVLRLARPPEPAAQEAVSAPEEEVSLPESEEDFLDEALRDLDAADKI